MTNKKKILRIANDLDGTLYDLMPINFGITNEIFGELGYPFVSEQKYRKNFQSKDWRKFYRDLGVKEDDIDRVIQHFIRLRQTRIPLLIPGAINALERQESAVGESNLYFITQAPGEEVEFRFKRDGLTRHLPRVITPYQGKSKQIYDLAVQDSESNLAYVGDIVSDGESCRDAREMGADNVFFYGICHPPAFNTSGDLKNFARENPTFASTIDSLKEVGRIWMD